jgi:hypothetical protein
LMDKRLSLEEGELFWYNNIFIKKKLWLIQVAQILI